MAKNLFISLLILLFFIFLLHYSIFKKNDSASFLNREEFVIADFNTIPTETNAPAFNNINGQYGIWNRYEDDITQQCTLSFSENDYFKNGYAIMLDYDVNSPNPAYNGFWMKLNDIDLTAYNTLHVCIKGNGPDFTNRLKIELKDDFTTAAFIVDGITEDWNKFSIPFEKYKKIQNWTSMQEFVIVFDDINSRPKSGSILIDHITVSYTNNKR